jgi:hypothetical protein
MSEWIERGGFLAGITSISAGAGVYEGAHAGLTVFGFLLCLVFTFRGMQQ